jgi:hypothetical protein
MLELYDSEVKEVYRTIRQIQTKWSGKPNTAENMSLISNEIKGRMEDLGFRVIVDPTPTIEGLPVDVRIESRIHPHNFDHEKKRHEVKKSRKQGGV